MAYVGLTMKPDAKQAWIEALESGNFSQGHNYLKQKKSKGKSAYCCMGVFCEIQGVESKIVMSDGIYDFHFYKTKQFRESGLPNPNWFGRFFKFKSDGACNLSKRTSIDLLADKLAALNDTDKKKFKTIAKWIRENL